MEYIREPKEDPEGRCVFCTLLAEGLEGQPGPLLVGERAWVTLAKYPYNPGHLLVLPVRHEGELDGLADEETDELSRLLRRAVAVLREASQPHGFNVGLNLGRAAGAGIPAHLHWHVIPRWGGDSNFMPVVGHTRVLPELLAETYARLKPRFDA
jgi:ATP adenylyltransferase